MKRNRTKGFTLIEVTLAIVIGIVLIAGATLIYNQAKASAGNSRAQAKVVSMQSLVEQYMARADGVPPDITVVRALWERARPDDFNKSPWGGLVMPTVQGTATTSGVIDGNTLDAANFTQGGDHILGNEGGAEGAPLPPPDSSWTGTLIYYRWPDAATYFVWDENRRTALPGKTYTVCSTNQKGMRWFYVRGNATGLSGEDAKFGITGQIQN